MVGRKLWERQYVDGNGGNISVRLGSKYVLCTPTMMSKRDLQPADICLSDLEGNILAGDRMRTSELLLHLEIYKANSARPGSGSLPSAVCHCLCHYRLRPARRAYLGVRDLHRPGRPSRATRLPARRPLPRRCCLLCRITTPSCLPITASFAGLTRVTHAEWLVEILETYCKTYVIAQQIGEPLTYIPDDKIEEILALKRRMGLPDARMARLPEPAGSAPASDAELDHVVSK